MLTISWNICAHFNKKQASKQARMTKKQTNANIYGILFHAHFFVDWCAIFSSSTALFLLQCNNVCIYYAFVFPNFMHIENVSVKFIFIFDHSSVEIWNGLFSSSVYWYDSLCVIELFKNVIQTFRIKSFGIANVIVAISGTFCFEAKWMKCGLMMRFFNFRL